MSGSVSEKNIGKAFRDVERGDWLQLSKITILRLRTRCSLHHYFEALYTVSNKKSRLVVCVCVYFLRQMGVIGLKLRPWAGKRHELYICNCSIVEYFHYSLHYFEVLSPNLPPTKCTVPNFFPFKVLSSRTSSGQTNNFWVELWTRRHITYNYGLQVGMINKPGPLFPIVLVLMDLKWLNIFVLVRTLSENSKAGKPQIAEWGEFSKSNYVLVFAAGKLRLLWFVKNS